MEPPTSPLDGGLGIEAMRAQVAQALAGGNRQGQDTLRMFFGQVSGVSGRVVKGGGPQDLKVGSSTLDVRVYMHH